jgi:FixJ family two-component response regulator
MMPVQPRIAIVDDEEPVRKALQRLLCSYGMDARTFPSGTELLDAMVSYEPDCLVLDLHMPGISGFDLQEQLPQAGKRIPVVVITGDDKAEARERALGGGAAAYLIKPIDERLLLDAISAAIASGKAE